MIGTENSYKVLQDTNFQGLIFTVDGLLRKRQGKGAVEYLIKWRNYPTSESTWERESNILDKSLTEHFQYRVKYRQR